MVPRLIGNSTPVSVAGMILSGICIVGVVVLSALGKLDMGALGVLAPLAGTGAGGAYGATVPQHYDLQAISPPPNPPSNVTAP